MPSESFSELVFEATIKYIDYNSGWCKLEPKNLNPGTYLDALIPNFAGAGDPGLFIGFRTGTKVVAMYTSGRSPYVTVVGTLLPEENLYPNPMPRVSETPRDMPRGTAGYPVISAGDVYLRGVNSSEVSFKNGDINIIGVNGYGIRLKKNMDKLSSLHMTEDILQYSNAGRSFFGAIRRMPADLRGLYPTSDLNIAPFFSDLDYTITKPIGFFTNSKALMRTFDTQKRNPELSEYRFVINEFTTNSMFTGFDDELKRALREKSQFENSETYRRNREPSNVLHMAEHELIEFVGGNLVDINGAILDINYKKLNYGNNNSVPEEISEKEYEDARKISRRGIGCHFQLSTNTKSDDNSNSIENFVFDIDKEGMLKVNIPASSNSGNIPFSSSADYVAGEGDSIIVENLNPSIKELIPVTLRDENGNPVYPERNASNIYRKTGIRVSNEKDPAYFNTSGQITDESRVNTTKYHNMYAAAERLIANTVSTIYIPPIFAVEKRKSIFSGAGEPTASTPIFKPFEVARAKITNFPTDRSTVGVEPGRPAIYHGGGGAPYGGTAIAGVFYPDRDDESPPYSNTTDDKKILNKSVAPVGGKSVNANLEGSIELSVGKDNWDQKSIILDTAGSIISWLGKDKNGRSMIVQTDGDVLFNIGGSYQPGDNPIMNKGRFDLRVNVTDKKFVSTEFESDKAPENGGNPGGESDYIISISDKGLVIAGMKKDAPMVIRNDGPLLLESSSAAVTIKGTQIITVDSKLKNKPVRPSEG